MISNSTDMKNSRILIIDDHQDTNYLMSSILEGNGYNSVTSITDSRRALATFREFVPDLVILESNLASGDGMAILSEMRTIREADYVPIVVVTSDVTPQSRQRALSLGATGFLTRPVDFTEMMSRVQTLLRMRHCHVRLFRPASSLSLYEARYQTAQTVIVAEHCPVVLY